MTHIFDVILKRYETSKKPNTCIFYDEDRDVAINEMGKYVKSHGFSIIDGKNTFTIADVILRERESTGRVISEIPYHKIFNTVSGKLIN